MRRQYKLIIVVLILFLSVGFAYLTANLDITGTIAFRENTWDVHLDNIVVEEDSTDAPIPTINNSKDTVTFTVSLTRPGDYYEFYVDVVNAGTMDATLDSTMKTTLTGNYLTNLNYDVTYFSDRTITNGDLLRAGQKERIKIRVEYKYDLNSYTQLSDLNLFFKVNYVKTDTHSSTYNSKVWNFDSKGEEDTFVVPKTGTYKLEVWGAQGGSISYNSIDYLGGYGGYSVGTINLTKDSSVFVNVGSSGRNSYNQFLYDVFQGGYNGGGTSQSSYNDIRTGGGGATHIALVSGVLKDLSSYKGTLISNTYYSSTNIIIVAGGGGGAGYHLNTSIRNGGSAGGYIGSDGDGLPNDASYDMGKGLGGSQTTGGKSARDLTNGKFGVGCSYGSPNASAGGGGLYGGGCGYSTASAGGGGSGYIGNTNLTNKIMYCYNCQSSENEADETHIKTRSTTNVSDTPTSNYAKTGHGYARITYVGN
ncbi:MAG: glycine rich domain-containing protein [Bacilli bacterium]|nr:glycine rich domain-containing protein [Bacilli bacterium]